MDTVYADAAHSPVSLDQPNYSFINSSLHSSLLHSNISFDGSNHPPSNTFTNSNISSFSNSSSSLSFSSSKHSSPSKQQNQSTQLDSSDSNSNKLQIFEDEIMDPSSGSFLSFFIYYSI